MPQEQRENLVTHLQSHQIQRQRRADNHTGNVLLWKTEVRKWTLISLAQQDHRGWGKLGTCLQGTDNLAKRQAEH